MERQDCDWEPQQGWTLSIPVNVEAEINVIKATQSEDKE